MNKQKKYKRFGIAKHIYPYYSTDSDELKATKIRHVKTKDFHATGDMTTNVGLFGQQTCRGGGKYINAIAVLWDRSFIN